MTQSKTFVCPCCGKNYEELPLCFGNDYPFYYYSIPVEERASRIELAESLCVIDEKFFFHRGRLTIPIIDNDEALIFNVWTSISEDNFRVRNEMWNDPIRINNEPYFGWLQTEVPTYVNTINIETIAYENKIGLIPTIEIIKSNHALYNDQQNGIDFKAAKDKVQQILKTLHSDL